MCLSFFLYFCLLAMRRNPSQSLAILKCRNACVTGLAVKYTFSIFSSNFSSLTVHLKKSITSSSVKCRRNLRLPLMLLSGRHSCLLFLQCAGVSTFILFSATLKVCAIGLSGLLRCSLHVMPEGCIFLLSPPRLIIQLLRFVGVFCVLFDCFVVNCLPLLVRCCCSLGTHDSFSSCVMTLYMLSVSGMSIV